jgi:stage II sporulation protein D
LKLSGGNPQSFLVSASTLRFSVGRSLGWNKIRSDLYEVRSADDHVLFSGRGSGHGVGLCQGGAQEMGRQGKTYREILSFYYPGTQLVQRSDSADAGIWQMRTSERLELLSTNPDADSTVLPIADRILRENKNSIGWQLQFRVRLQVFSSLDRYRDTTGEPGWIAASTRGHVIRMQPLDDLRRKGVLESTLRHEFYHLLVDAQACADTPLWFREGLVLFLSDPNEQRNAPASLTMQRAETILRQQSNRVELEQAYAAAQVRVAALIHQYGKQTVLGWLRSGVPADAGTGTAAHPNLPTDH